MADKLQIEATRLDSSASISEVVIGVGDDFVAFARYCERNAAMIVALAQVERQRQRDDEGEIREHRRPIEAQLAGSMDREREQAAEIERLRTRLAGLEEDNRVLRARITEG